MGAGRFLKSISAVGAAVSLLLAWGPGPVWAAAGRPVHPTHRTAPSAKPPAEDPARPPRHLLAIHQDSVLLFDTHVLETDSTVRTWLWILYRKPLMRFDHRTATASSDLFDVDCKEGRYRGLATVLYDSDMTEMDRTTKTDVWTYIAPGTEIEAGAKVLCGDAKATKPETLRGTIPELRAHFFPEAAAADKAADEAAKNVTRSLVPGQTVRQAVGSDSETLWLIVLPINRDGPIASIELDRISRRVNYAGSYEVVFNQDFYEVDCEGRKYRPMGEIARDQSFSVVVSGRRTDAWINIDQESKAESMRRSACEGLFMRGSQPRTDGLMEMRRQLIAGETNY